MPTQPKPTAASNKTPPVKVGTDWRVDVLRALNAPVTQANLNFLNNWQRHEGGHTNNSAHWNWLNSTAGSGFPRINSVGVRSYPNYSLGIAYTASTIRNGNYQNVVRGLQKGNPYDPTLRQGILGDLSTWVSGSRTNGLSYAASVLGQAANVPVGKASGAGGTTLNPNPFGGKDLGDKIGGAVGGALEHIPGVKQGEAVVHGAEATAHGVSWVFGNWDRVLEVIGGSVLVIIGLLLIGKQTAMTAALPKGMSGMAEAAGAYKGGRDYARMGSPPRARPSRLRESVPANPPRVRRGSPGSSQLAAGDSLPF